RSPSRHTVGVVDADRETTGPAATQLAAEAVSDADAQAARRAGELLLRVAAVLDEIFRDASADEDLEPFEARLLAAAARPMPQAALAAALGTDPPRVSNVSAKLERRGLLRRTPARGDRRVRCAELTDEGRATVGRIGERLRATSP